MKKALAAMLVLCLILGVFPAALAAGKPVISIQPESATTDEKGNVSFSVKATNIEGLTWRFVNPDTGEEITGKNLSKKINGVKVDGANGKTIKLKNVPASMHGWTVYCHIYGNGYQVDSDRVVLLVHGMDTPSVPEPDAGTEMENIDIPDKDTAENTETAPAPDQEQPDAAPTDTTDTAPANTDAAPVDTTDTAPADTGTAPADGSPAFTKQPKNATTDEKGSVSFKVKTSGAESISWRFVNPETGKETTAKKLSKEIEGISVSGAAKETVKLKKVPESMHGWTVYCRITGSGQTVDSERVLLLVNGLDASAVQIVEAPAAETVETAPDSGAEPSPAAPAEDVQEENTTFTIRGENVVIYPIDAYGNRNDAAASFVQTFERNGNFVIQASGEVKCWLINGIQIETSTPVSEFTLQNVTTNLTITAVLVQTAPVESESGATVHVTCRDCVFTYAKGDLKNVTNGDVPAGATIVIAAEIGAAAKGYSINGGNPEHIGEVSFRLTVNEDTSVVIR